MTRPLPQEDLEFILQKTSGLWEELHGQCIFISGGTGFFGSWLVESFLWANRQLSLNATLTVLTRNAEAYLRKSPHLASQQALHIVQGDVRTFEFPEGDYPFIIHAATEASLKLSVEDPFQMLSTIVDGTRRMLDFAQAKGARNFLLTSSGAVYGKQPSEMVHMPESYCGGPDPLNAASVYGEGKRMVEHLCALYAANSTVQYKIARCFAFVGPHLPLDTHFAIGNFILDAIEHRPIRIQGDGTPTRSYLYAADLAIWLWTILFKGKPLRPYNVGSDESVSIYRLASAVVDTLAPGNPIEVMKQAPPGAPVSRYVPDTRFACDDLGLQVWVDLPEAIRRTAVWRLQS